MKCPKCGYISFDYNQACPKCNKDLTAERERMNLPAYIPKPPSLLSSLTGEDEESTMDLKVESTGGMEAVEEGGMLTPEDSQTIEAMEEAFKDSQELEIQIEPGPDEELEELQEPDIPSTLEPQAAEIEPQVDEPDVTPPLEDGAEEPAPDLQVELSDLTPQTAEAEPQVEEPDVSPPLEDGAEEPAPDLQVELSDLTPQAAEKVVQEEETTLTLDLEDGAEEPALDLGDLTLEDSEAGPPQVEQKTGDEIAPELVPSSPEGEDMEKTAAFESVEEVEATESFDLDDISLDELGTSPEGTTPEKVQEGTLVDLEELSLMVDDLAEDEKRAEVAPSAKGKEEDKDEGFSLDLETLELDLELEEPEDKSS
jgi:hypothetical protein